MAEIEARLDSLADGLASGAFPSGSKQFVKMTETARNLNAQREALQAQPVEHGRYEYRPTGQTFADDWTRRSDQERNTFLREHSVTLHFYNPPRADGVIWDFTLGDVPSLLAVMNLELDQDAMRQVISADIDTNGPRHLGGSRRP